MCRKADQPAAIKKACAIDSVEKKIAEKAVSERGDGVMIPMGSKRVHKESAQIGTMKESADELLPANRFAVRAMRAIHQVRKKRLSKKANQIHMPVNDARLTRKRVWKEKPVMSGKKTIFSRRMANAAREKK